MANKIEESSLDIQNRFHQELANVQSLEALQDLRIRYSGKKGSLTELMKLLGTLAPEDRKAAGASINKVKDLIETALQSRQEQLLQIEEEQKLLAGTIDITLPPRPEKIGKIHPISQTIDEIIAIFGEMGFVLAEGPDIESDFHNFTALNIPADHPARQMHDTFYLPEKEDGTRAVLRTHTSPVQIRTLIKEKPPIRVICPGRTYRCDSDMTHTPMFHQVEGLVIDTNTHMGHLKGCLIDFVRTYFNIADLKVRFRPSFFPFTEPSAEMDIGCDRSGGELKLGKGSDWLEILGCGMVHPRVLENCGIDSTQYQGFAFGMGIERIAMLKYGIPDLRTFFESDYRWLTHYGFAVEDVPSLTGGLSDENYPLLVKDPS